MKTFKGVYENGEIRLLDKSELPVHSKVLITFIDEEDEDEVIRHLSLQRLSHFDKEYINDEREDLYQEHLKGL